MPAKFHSKEGIIQILKNVAAQMGKRTLSKQQISAHLPESSIRYYFGNLSNALEAAGLDRQTRDLSTVYEKKRYSEEELFSTILQVEQRIGHEPNFSEYRGNGGTLSQKPFKERFGAWTATLDQYRKWKQHHDKIEVASGAESRNRPMDTEPTMPQKPAEPAMSLVEYRTPSRKPQQLYGEPIDFRGLRHAPINEQGVVYLFGMVSRELGFSIEALQQGFPDCEGKYLHDKSRKIWAKARIEFEFRASNFREHCHNENDCDVIVCWENDWPDAPLRVVELRTEIMRLDPR